METNVILPQLGESIAEGTVTRWFKKPGETVQRDEPLFEISTDKVDSEIPSPASGVVTKILAAEGTTVPVNTVVAVIDTEASAGAAAPAPVPAAAPAVAEPRPPEITTTVEKKPAPAAPAPEIRSSPLVRKIARENAIDIATVPGTGAGGRVTKKDVMTTLERPAAPAAPPRPEAPARPAISFTGREHREPMSTMRRAIAEHMVLSKRTSPHVTTVHEVDLFAVSRSRDAQKQAFQVREGFSLTWLPYLAFAAIQALKKHPIVNATVADSEIVYRNYVNLGIAVALEGGGLIVPVIKNADEKSFIGIARAIRQLGDAARNKKLSPDDVQGGTFTITNYGIFGSLFGTPIINQPQLAILGLGAVVKRAVVVNDAIAIRPMVYLSMSFDHRAIDGSLADPFMADIRKILENWAEDDAS